VEDNIHLIVQITKKKIKIHRTIWKYDKNKILEPADTTLFFLSKSHWKVFKEKFVAAVNDYHKYRN